eukprot:Tbor_TRINITY_DN5895_c0_g1::TRINITY_DN5895_c0_g1_i7::g.7095::m.7095
MKILDRACPKQPENSSQCGLHLLVNATAVAKGKMLRRKEACYEQLLPFSKEAELVKRILELVTRMPDAHQTNCHQEAKKRANKRDGQQLREETKQHGQQPSPTNYLYQGRKPATAVDSAKKDQCSMPRK